MPGITNMQAFSMVSVDGLATTGVPPTPPQTGVRRSPVVKGSPAPNLSASVPSSLH